MDFNVIAQLVGSLGFPIVCCGALFWYITKIMQNFTSEIRIAIEKLSIAIQANTDATIKLETTVEIMNKIGGKEGG